MKERPILFNSEMVRAILEGRKTQTRRVVKPQPKADQSFVGWITASTIKGEVGKAKWAAPDQPPFETRTSVRCPCGARGDRLWVKETWTTAGCRKAGSIEDVQYRADEDDDAVIWIPSIFMPRWASRITLEVVSVRVERLQDMADGSARGCEDAIAEGINRGAVQYRGHEVELYKNLWESINGPGSWDTNPWVWVVEFRHVEPVPGSEGIR